jgi:hypothetical protein
MFVESFSSYSLPISWEFVIAFIRRLIYYCRPVFLGELDAVVYVRPSRRRNRQLGHISGSQEIESILRLDEMLWAFISGWILTFLTLASWPSIIINIVFIEIQEYSIWTSGRVFPTFWAVGSSNWFLPSCWCGLHILTG